MISALLLFIKFDEIQVKFKVSGFLIGLFLSECLWLSLYKVTSNIYTNYWVLAITGIGQAYSQFILQ